MAIKPSRDSFGFTAFENQPVYLATDRCTRQHDSNELRWIADRTVIFVLIFGCLGVMYFYSILSIIRSMSTYKEV